MLSSPNVVQAPSFIEADMLAGPPSDFGDFQEDDRQGISESIRNLGATVVGFAENGYNYMGTAISAVTDFVGVRAPSPRLPSAVTARLAVGVLALGAGVTGLDTAVAVAQGPVKPETPKQVLNTINYDFTEMFPLDTSTFNLRGLVLSSRQLVKKGACNPSSPEQPNTQEIDYSLKGEYTKFCTKVNGVYQTLTIPHRSIVYPPAAVTMNFTPTLSSVGDKAAESVGLVSGQFGSPQRADISTQPARKVSEADIFYGKNPATNGMRQLRELKLRVVKGAERVTKVWYK